MRLDDPEAVLKDATRTSPVDGSMQVISPGDRDHSALMHRITATDPARRMPFRGEPLSAREVTLIGRWIDQYEMAARMQLSVPDLTDLSTEPASTFDLYGPEARERGTFAANCLLARRLAERGVRYVMLSHTGWDHHSNLQLYLPQQCQQVDQGSAALVQDLKQRGMLDETIVVWGGEFGRTAYGQFSSAVDTQATANSYGRDHNPKCYTVWMAGGGIKPGITYGETDDYSANITRDPVSIHDLQATILHAVGIDHTRLTYKYQGRDFRLTDVAGKVVHDVLA